MSFQIESPASGDFPGDIYLTEFGQHITLNSLLQIHENYLEISSEKKLVFIKNISFIMWDICKWIMCCIQCCILSNWTNRDPVDSYPRIHLLFKKLQNTYLHNLEFTGRKGRIWIFWDKRKFACTKKYINVICRIILKGQCLSKRTNISQDLHQMPSTPL